MTLPPLLLRLRVYTAAHRWPTLWLPLFLVWPLLFMLLALLGLVVLLVAAVLAPQQIPRAFELARALLAVFCLRGLHIDVVGRHRQLLLSFH